MAVYEAAWRRLPTIHTLTCKPRWRMSCTTFHSDLLIPHWQNRSRSQHPGKPLAPSAAPAQASVGQSPRSRELHAAELAGPTSACCWANGARPLLSKALATADSSLYADIQKNLAQHPIAADHTMRAMVRKGLGRACSKALAERAQAR